MPVIARMHFADKTGADNRERSNHTKSHIFLSLNRFKMLTFNNHRCGFIERICAYGEREEEGIIIFQVFHIGNPFADKQVIGPFYIAGEMVAVGLRHIGKGTSVCQFFRQMKDSAKKISEGLVFKQYRIFQKPQKKIPFTP